MKPVPFAAAVAALCSPPAVVPAAAQPAAEPVTTVVITGNPLGSGERAQPAAVLDGRSLMQRAAGSLGETLDGLPGVAATSFGPAASRPVIRGLDGERVRVLENTGASIDASALSFDHAVPAEALIAERIEVLRGPAALLYGGGALGGVVNVIDNRIPRSRPAAPTGRAEWRVGGAARESAVAAVVDGGASGTAGLAWHADAFVRRSGDLAVAPFERLLEGGDSESRRRVRNSAAAADGGAVGTSWVGPRGFIGASLDSHRSDYGIVVEPDVTIRMQRDRVALAGEWRGDASAPLQLLRARAARADYRHREIDGAGAVGTTFLSDGGDARLEAVHRAVALGDGRLEGSVGWQWESVRFSALGEEAFVPGTHTRHAALFALERWRWGDGHHVAAGLRTERVTVRSDGDADPAAARFGAPAARRFSPRSLSLEAVLRTAPGWQAAANWSDTERAPSAAELFARGVHAATAAYEEGDPQLRLERGRHAELSLGWRGGRGHLEGSAYVTRFSNHILLAATGAEFTDPDGERFPVYAFRGVRARLSGFELEGGWRLIDGAQTLDLEARLDRVAGRDIGSGEPLPRLAPRRVALGLVYARGPWKARAEWKHAAAQRRVPATDTPTPGWNIVDLSLTRALRLGPRDATAFVRLQNAGNEAATQATAVATVRALSPLPGRALSAGIRVGF